MFDVLAGMFMAMKIHFSQINPFKHRDPVISQYIYENKVNKAEEKERYEKSRMPESGYMTVEEYEAISRGKSKKEIEVQDAQIPKDSNMIYIPQKTFKLVKYNDPIGSPELCLPRRLNFDRQINAQGIVSGDKTILVYPAVYYYAQADCTACDLFLIKLNTSLDETERVKKANIIQREESPLISTDKSIDEKYIFRTLTPIDFSADNKNLPSKKKSDIVMTVSGKPICGFMTLKKKKQKNCRKSEKLLKNTGSILQNSQKNVGIFILWALTITMMKE